MILFLLQMLVNFSAFCLSQVNATWRLWSTHVNLDIAFVRLPLPSFKGFFWSMDDNDVMMMTKVYFFATQLGVLGDHSVELGDRSVEEIERERERG